MNRSGKNQHFSNRSPASADDLRRLWRQFLSEFPTEVSCTEEIYRRAGEKLLNCHHCFQPLIQRQPGARVIRCSRCGKRTRPLSGTFFHGMRRGKAWLAIIWFFEHGIAINGWKLHELSGVAQSSAFNLLKKFAAVIQDQLPEDAESASSALFSNTFTKRSRATPAGQHPRAEEEAIVHTDGTLSARVDSESEPSLGTNGAGPAIAPSDSDDDGAITGVSAIEVPAIDDDNQRKVYSMLSNEPTHFDTLCYKTELPTGTLGSALIMLELDGLIVRLIGEYYIRKVEDKSNGCAPARVGGDVSPQMSERVNEIINFVSATWKGISRKYLQNYVGVFWFITDTSSPRERLFAACLRSGPIKQQQVLSYLTPKMVRIG